MKSPICTAIVIGIASFWTCVAVAQDARDADDVAKQLQNPVANLISVPFQNTFDFGLGSNDDGILYTLNIQPVIPISLGDDWNLITRTIMPVVYRDLPGISSDTGLGDIVQSFFFSPKKPGKFGIIWGVGPVFQYPTATNNRLGSEKFGLGPTAVVLRQSGGWTVGALANHIWSVAGNSSRRDISVSLLQPFVSYTFRSATTISASLELTHNWTTDATTMPLNIGASQTFKLWGQVMSFGLTGRYFVQRPAGGPDWGIRAQLTLIFPKGR
jgi:hypothetical protein